MFDLSGKVALVTGGSRGIGRAASEALAKQGAHVVINYVSNESAARETAQAIEQAGGKAELLQFDVANGEAAEKAITEVAKRLGRLDILVASAGIAIDGLLLRLKDDDFDRILSVNVKGSVACARAAIRTMMRAKTGRIVFVSSVVERADGRTEERHADGRPTRSNRYRSRNRRCDHLPGFRRSRLRDGPNAPRQRRDVHVNFGVSSPVSQKHV
jgi:NAD(P)-dependent dehydrogenase (short-subunit alcohol dehydrogenase family)